jgi:ABC-type lipoprotein release transport system permease subunit
MDAVLFESLPWPEPDRLVAVHGVLPDRRANPATAPTWDRMPLTWTGWVNVHGAPELERVAAFHPTQRAFGAQRDDIVDALYVSSGFLPLVGGKVALGRAFLQDEDDAAADIAMLSHDAWQRRFAGRPDIVGEAIHLGPPNWSDGDSSDPFRIVGVLAPAFRFDGREPEVLLPLGALPHPWRGHGSRYVHVTARLASGVRIDVAETAVRPLVAGPEPPEQQTARLRSFADDHVAAATGPLRLLFAGAAALLLLACVNVAGLLLGDARARRHEIGVRIAMGGSRSRVVRQLAVEHAMLAGVASVAGLILAGWLTPAFIAVAPDGLPRLDEVGIDNRVGGFALALGLVTTALFGIGPSLSLAGTPAAAVLAEGGRDGTGVRTFAQRTTVVVQIAMAFVLVVSAGLLGETIYRLTSAPLGFDPDHLAVIQTTVNVLPVEPLECSTPLPQPAPGSRGVPPCAPIDVIRNRIRDGQTGLVAGLIEGLSAVPGVASAAGVSVAPFNGTVGEFDITAGDELRPVGMRGRRIGVTDGFFDTMGLPVLAGKGFGPSDGSDTVAVVSHSFAERVFEGAAVGRVISYADSPERYTVIGVVPDIRSREMDADDSPVFYIRNHRMMTTQFVVRLSTDAPAPVDALRQAVREHHPQSVVTSAYLMSDRLAGLLAAERLRAALSAVFGGVALAMAAVGLFVLAARQVVERRREIGVRIAVGASPSDVGLLVVGDAARTVLFGLVLGAPLAFVLGHAARAYLVGVSPTAPHLFLLAAGVLAVATILAVLLPAYRASRIDPVSVLKG